MDAGYLPQPGIHLRTIQDRLSRVLSELNRISYLVIRRLHLSSSHFAHLHLPAPSLDLFSFEGCGSDPVRLPAPLFDNNAPRLRSLRLSSALIEFSRALYPSLMELFVHDIHHPLSPTMSTWITFLSNHTSLTSLNLSYAISVHSSDAHEWLSTVELAHLQELTLTDDATACAQLLTKLVVPPACKISIIAGFDNRGGVDLLKAGLSTLVTPRIAEELEVTLTSTSVCFLNVIDNASSPPQGSLFFKLQWQTASEPLEDSTLLYNPIDSFPTGHLTSIGILRLVFIPINGQYPLHDAWLRTNLEEWLRHLSSVHHLIVDSSSLDLVFDLLTDDEAEEGSPLQFVFPSLQIVEIVKSQDEEVDWGAFISFAEWRNDVGHKINSIRVPRADVDHLSWEDGCLVADLGIEIILS